MLTNFIVTEADIVVVVVVVVKLVVVQVAVICRSPYPALLFIPQTFGIFLLS